MAPNWDGLAPSHMANVYQQYAYPYSSYLWMDPGAPEVSQRLFDVVTDIVTRHVHNVFTRHVICICHLIIRRRHSTSRSSTSGYSIYAILRYAVSRRSTSRRYLLRHVALRHILNVRQYILRHLTFLCVMQFYISAIIILR